MNREEIFAQVVEICQDIFDNDEVVITETSTAADVDEWDSLTHLSLIDELEKKFGVAFTLDEVIGSSCIGELVTALIRHVDEKRETD